MKIRSTFTLSQEAVISLKRIAKKTNLKMSTIIELGILEMLKKYEEGN